MIRIKETYAPGEYPWTEQQVLEVRRWTEAAIRLAAPQAKLAAWLGVKQQNVAHWLAEGCIPKGHALAVSEVSGVPVEQLRPDLYRKWTNRIAEYRGNKLREAS